MPLRDSYPAGTPSWVDLVTTDIEGAFDFYRAVLGWEYERDPTGEISYVMAMVDGHPAAGVMALPTEMIDQNVPPCWNVYITVDDTDATAQRIADLGGAVMRPPFDVPEGSPDPAGRMVIGADPTGAVFCAWKTLGAIGTDIVNAPGAFTWAETFTNDLDTAVAFYCKLFGWEASSWDELGPSGRMFTLGGEPIASISGEPPPGVPPHWKVSFGAADVDAACEAATANGGTVLMPPTDWGPGRVATVADPAGAVFDLVTLSDWPK